MEHPRTPSRIAAFFHHDAAGGICLMIATALALIVVNSPLGHLYEATLKYNSGFRIGSFEMFKSVDHWINDGLMVIFFLLVGMEIKREMISGELATKAQRILPGMAALGGMIIPALIYICITYANPTARNGWAIPSATDIAFSLGVLSLLGSRVPIALKVFLTALAIIDDLGAIVIIAAFYTQTIDVWFLCLSAFFTVLLFLLLKLKINWLSPFIMVGVALWYCILGSGVHATIAGVIIGLCIPDNDSVSSPLKRLEKALHPWVIFGILPIFAFANSGIQLQSISIPMLFSGITLGIAIGLFLGKQIGIFLFTWLAVRLKLAKLPKGSSWMQVYGVALLGGIGFTMSLFIGTLAFTSDEFLTETRLGVILGSTLSALAGYFVLLKAKAA